jgi:alpha-amylase
LLDQAERGDGAFLTASVSPDLADLHPEITVRSESLVAVCDPSHGGSLVEISDLARAFLLSDVLTRREEGYHERLRHPERSSGDPTLVKEANLDRYLVFDGYRRASFLDRFYAPDFKLDDLRAGQDGDGGTLATSIYTSTEDLPAGAAPAIGIALQAEGQVRLPRDGQDQGEAHRVRIQKRFGFDKGRAGFEVSYRLTHDGAAPLKAFFAPEINLTLLAGNADDRVLELPGDRRERLGFRGEVQGLREVRLFDGWSRLRVRLSALRPFDLWTYPVETVSQSEGGFERTYQGTCLLLRTPVEIPAGASLDLSFGLDLEHLT